MRRRFKPMTPRQQRSFDAAERIGTRATVLQIGVAEFLRTTMPSNDEVRECAEILREAANHRDESVAIHQRIQNAQDRRRKPTTAQKSK